LLASTAHFSFPVSFDVLRHLREGRKRAQWKEKRGGTRVVRVSWAILPRFSRQRDRAREEKGKKGLERSCGCAPPFLVHRGTGERRGGKKSGSKEKKGGEKDSDGLALSVRQHNVSQRVNMG